jgi:hypothetical protein
MPVVRAAMHLAAGYDIDASYLLLKNRGLGRTKLRIRQICLRELAEAD